MFFQFVMFGILWVCLAVFMSSYCYTCAELVVQLALHLWNKVRFSMSFSRESHHSVVTSQALLLERGRADLDPQVSYSSDR